MARGKKKSNIDWKKETIDEAVKTGFLFGRSINYYENHTREELIQKGEDKARIDIAEEVLKAFETSVGAKLGKCKPELWSIRPCDDCGKTVDTQKCDPAFSAYGSFLCKRCQRARVERSRCVDCGDKCLDPSHSEFRINPYVNRHSWLPDNPFVCRWCALFRGDMEFIEKRTPKISDDKRTLTAELNLTRLYKHILSTGEVVEQVLSAAEVAKEKSTETQKVEYLFLPRNSKDIEEDVLRYKWEDSSPDGKGFFMRFTGYVREIRKEPPKHYTSHDFLINHPDDHRKIVKIIRIQVFHRSCQGYLETLWNPSPSTINLKNLNPDNAENEAKTLTGAKSLVFDLERQSRRGRPPGSRDKSRPVVLSALRGALMELGPEALWETVISYSGIKRATLYEYLEEYGITNEEIESLRDEVRKERGPTCLSCKRPL